MTLDYLSVWDKRCHTAGVYCHWEWGRLVSTIIMPSVDGILIYNGICNFLFYCINN